ncbi:hypothetical protein SAMN06298224_0873 [Fibrobacter sp. UWB16]|nr:hypothetical protein SAMN06298224_0873 [Fibrobacter sp. UWB16]
MQGECSKNEYTHSYCRAAAVMPRSGMTKEPSDAETCLHVSISEANKSDPFRGMTCKGIKREVSCDFAFDTRSSQTSKRNDCIVAGMKKAWVTE